MFQANSFSRLLWQVGSLCAQYALVDNVLSFLNGTYGSNIWHVSK